MGCFVAGIVIGSPLVIFFDVTSILIATLGPIGLLALANGRGAMQLLSAFRAWVIDQDSDDKPPDYHVRIAAMALEFGHFSILIGAISMNIGHVQMLLNMSESETINLHPALAVSVLTLLYGLLVHTLIALPLHQHHLRMAGSDAELFPRFGPRLGLLGVMGLSTGLGLFVLLPAMADF